MADRQPAPIWLPWIGLPHQIGEDPDNREGACCLVMAQKVLANAGFTPPDISTWLDYAKQNRWVELKCAFMQHCEPTASKELWSLVLLTHGKRGALGIGIVIYDDLLLFPHHRQGVTTAPLSLLRPFEHYRLKQRP
jgi:hypothetical protein